MFWIVLYNKCARDLTVREKKDDRGLRASGIFHQQKRNGFFWGGKLIPREKREGGGWTPRARCRTKF